MKPKDMEVTIKVRCIDLPVAAADSSGCQAYFLGVQCGEEVVDNVRVGDEPVEFEVQFRVAERGDGETNFLGSYAKGTPAERFFYLSWIAVGGDGRHERYGRLKVHLNHLKWSVVARAVAAGEPLRVELPLTDKRKRPRCGSIREGEARWSIT